MSGEPLAGALVTAPRPEAKIVITVPTMAGWDPEPGMAPTGAT